MKSSGSIISPTTKVVKRFAGASQNKSGESNKTAQAEGRVGEGWVFFFLVVKN